MRTTTKKRYVSEENAKFLFTEGFDTIFQNFQLISNIIAMSICWK